MKNKIFCKIIRSLRKATPTILTCAAAMGVIGTAISAARASIKAQELLSTAKKQKGEELTKVETVCAAVPAYLPPVAVGAATLACVIGSNFLNRKQQATIFSGYALLNEQYKQYRKAAKVVYGKEADAKINAQIAKDTYIDGDGYIYLPEYDESDKKLFYDMNSQKYFWATTSAVLNAIYHLNRNLALRGDATVNEFLDFIGIENVKDGDKLGWTSVEMAENGLLWLDFENVHTRMDDGLECYVISTCVSATPFDEYLLP